MFDPPSDEQSRMPKPSTPQVIAAVLVFSLVLGVYLISQPDVHALLVSPKDQASVQLIDSTDHLPGRFKLSTPTAGKQATAHPSEIDRMIAQMRDMQVILQSTTNLLEQKNQPAGEIVAIKAGQISSPGRDSAALWSEVEQLYQVMQPLMVQLQAATVQESSRSESELAAISAQVDAVHQRLKDLLSQLEAVNTQNKPVPNQANPPIVNIRWTTHGGWAARRNNLNQNTYQDLYQTMAEIRIVLQQMQSQ